MILAGAGCRACSVTRPPISPITRKSLQTNPRDLLSSITFSPSPPLPPPQLHSPHSVGLPQFHFSTNPMLRNALRRSNLSPSAARTTPFICHFCARLPPLPRHLSTTLPVCKGRSVKRDALPASDTASDTVLTELRKDIKESVAHKNEEKESRRWKKKPNNDTEPSTSEAVAKARNERQRRRKDKAKSDKAKRKEGTGAKIKEGTGAKITRQKVKREGERERVKGERSSQAVSVRRVTGTVLALGGMTPKDMGGVSLAAALKKRPKDKDMLTMDPGSDGVKRTQSPPPSFSLVLLRSANIRTHKQQST